MKTQYTRLPDDMGTPTNPIPVTRNVAKYHIKKLNNEFILGNTIVTDLYASTTCLLIDAVAIDNQPDTFYLNLYDGTGDLEYANIPKSKLSPQVFSILSRGYSTTTTTSTNATSKSIPTTQQYRQSADYPIIVDLVFSLNTSADSSTSRPLHYCELFDSTTLSSLSPTTTTTTTPTKITAHSEELYNIFLKHNIEKGGTFYEKYCLTSQQQLSLQRQQQQHQQETDCVFQITPYHRIFDNPYYPVEVMHSITPVDNSNRSSASPHKLLAMYHGRDITYRILRTIAYVGNITQCKRGCSTNCKRVDFCDVHQWDHILHLLQYPPKDSTCIFLHLIGVKCEYEYVDDDEDMKQQLKVQYKHSRHYTIGQHGHKDKELLDTHQKRAVEITRQIDEINQNYATFSKTKMVLQVENNKRLEQIKHLYNLVKLRLSSHPSLPMFIRPLQEQLLDIFRDEHTLIKSDNINDIRKALELNIKESDLLLQCKQIIDTLLNTNIALYNDFYDYYLPHLDEQLQSLQQQMHHKFMSNADINITTTQHILNNDNTIDIPLVNNNNNNNANGLLHCPFAYQLNRLNNYYPLSYSYNNYDSASRDSSGSNIAMFRYQRRPYITPPCEYTISAALQSFFHDQQQQQQQYEDQELTTSTTMTDSNSMVMNNSNSHNVNNNNNNNIINQYHIDLLTRHLTLISQNLINMNAEKEVVAYQIVQQHQIIIKEKEDMIKEKNNVILDNKIALQQQQTIIQAKDQHISQLNYEKLTLTKDYERKIATTTQQYENQISLLKQQLLIIENDKMKK